VNSSSPDRTEELTAFSKSCARAVLQTGYTPSWWFRPLDDKWDPGKRVIIAGSRNGTQLFFAFCENKPGRPYKDIFNARLRSGIYGNTSCAAIPLSWLDVEPTPEPAPEPVDDPVLPDTPPWEVAQSASPKTQPERILSPKLLPGRVISS
jgi:hypothetical protein